MNNKTMIVKFEFSAPNIPGFLVAQKMQDVGRVMRCETVLDPRKTMVQFEIIVDEETVLELGQQDGIYDEDNSALAVMHALVAARLGDLGEVGHCETDWV